MKKNYINYTNTINLPNNKFPMRGNLIKNEPKIIKKWNKYNIYKKININKKKKFIIHDGPPFANGKIHLGHALNKILKDIIIKHKVLNNYKIFYKPGWDCHGLPIELEIQKKYKKKLNNIKNLKKFKKKCLKYVIKQINIQKKEFIKLGIFADWNNYYKTIDYKLISKTILIFKKLIKKKLIIIKKKPINWCINCKSSLSDLELEYKNIKNKSIYITFKLKNKKKILLNLNIKKKYKNIKLIIWTTTPWTIPSNKAISINKKYKYSLIENNNNLYIIIKNKSKKICKILNINLKILKNIKGKILINKKYYHPISNKIFYIINNKYIKKNIGTGIVHLSPNHGEEDYEICNKNKIKGNNIINKKGLFKNYKYIKNLKNKSIYEGNKLIIIKLKKNILFKKTIIHKIAICWRHKSNIIKRSTKQLFINLNKNNLKKKILNNIKKINWKPKWGYNKIKNMIKERPNWCISRQRFWGTPITLFINKKTNKIHPNTNNLLKKISKKIKKYGPNYWLNVNKKKLIKEYKYYKKIKYVLDVWFDSGSTIFTTNKFKKIDIIIEGHDQYRGWFMSSLIINTALNKKIKYKKIISHGFILDKNGNKMSKSSNNYIEPKKIINKYGSDIIRLWISSNKFYNNINISEEIIIRITDLYRKIRNTFKFIISNLNEYNINKKIKNINNILLIDKWIIYKANKYNKKINILFNKLKYHKIIKKINKFFNYYLSSIYFNIIKDRKYIIKKNTKPVKSAQKTLLILFKIIIKWICPIIPFTSEEIWKIFNNNKKNNSIFTKINKNKIIKINKKKTKKNIWNKLLIIKNKLNKIIEKKKKKKIIKTSLETKIIIYINYNFFKKIKKMKSELKFFFITSKTKIKKINNKKKFYFNIKCKKYKGYKCSRCWNYVKYLKNNICKRCIININYNGEIRKYI